MAKPIVAIIGRPNVGKSTFFNYLAGKRISIVEDTPGVTRDRIYTEVEWRGRKFTLIDTGGIEIRDRDKIMLEMRNQAEIAIETADVIVFLVDLKDGVTPSDKEVASMLRKTKKPVILAVNKVDNIGEPPAEIYEFYNLGLGEFIAVSSIHGLGMGDLLDEIHKNFPEEKEEEADDDVIKVAIVGKPNVGKSSIVNKLVGEKRVIVSDIAGTTRDAIDTPVRRNKKEYVLIDTAGLRRKSRIKESLERFSIVRTVAAIERSDVVVLVIDATEGVTEQDAKIAGIAHDRGKGLIIAVNKWDLIRKDSKTVNKYTRDIKNILSFATYAEVTFISAVTGQRLNKLFDIIEKVIQYQNLRIATGVLNEILAEATSLQQPPSDKGKQLRLYYITQVAVKPPTFVIFVNDKSLMHFSYTRYIENKIREAFGFAGTSLRFIIRERKES
ncbi:MAG TPA: ribosome biogenesis GTPase Der [Ruminiclostridium sp.]|nr:ribosome biogenesis GTPase Der [Ruminiclostridium sp.]